MIVGTEGVHDSDAVSFIFSPFCCIIGQKQCVSHALFLYGQTVGYKRTTFFVTVTISVGTETAYAQF